MKQRAKISIQRVSTGGVAFGPSSVKRWHVEKDTFDEIEEVMDLGMTKSAIPAHWCTENCEQHYYRLFLMKRRKKLDQHRRYFS